MFTSEENPIDDNTKTQLETTITFLQEFFKDISNKKGNFRQIEGKSVQITKSV